MTHEEKEQIYKLLKDHFVEIDLCLSGVWRAWKQIEQGDEFKEPEPKIPYIIFCGIETKEDYEREWHRFKVEQNRILKALFDKDMLHWFIRDYSHPHANKWVIRRMMYRDSDNVGFTGYFKMPGNQDE